MLPGFSVDELEFAFVYHVYLRWKTHRAKPFPVLREFDLPVFQEIGSLFDLPVLEAKASDSEVLLTASLSPEEPVSACVSKLKGKTSKLLRETLGMDSCSKLLSRSYFACGVGRNTRKAVEDYLAKQAEHHGYDVSDSSPVFTREMQVDEETEARLQPKHARAVLNFHITLATQKRMILFHRAMAAALSDRWIELASGEDWFIRKVSLLPDHVHLALRLHPAVSPAEIVTRLMNSSQEFLFQEFRDEVLSRRMSQIWNPGAYIGSYGDITSQAVLKYIRDWEESPTDE